MQTVDLALISQFLSALMKRSASEAALSQRYVRTTCWSREANVNELSIVAGESDIDVRHRHCVIVVKGLCDGTDSRPMETADKEVANDIVPPGLVKADCLPACNDVCWVDVKRVVTGRATDRKVI